MENESPFRTEYVEGADGLRLALHCWGQENAAPVLFLHGFGQTAMATQLILEFLGHNPERKTA